MASLNEKIKKIQELRRKIQEDKGFIANEKASYEEKISMPLKRIKSNEYQAACIEAEDVFINIKDIVEETAKEWKCEPEALDVEILGGRHFNNNTDDAAMKKLTPYYSANGFLLTIKNKNNLFWVKFSINKTDIQLDGKCFEEHIIAKPCRGGKVCSVDDWKNIVLRVRLDLIVKIGEGNVEYQDNRGGILARAILRKEGIENKAQSEDDLGETESE